MEQMNNKRRMIDISTELLEGTGSLVMGDKSASKDNLSIPSFQYKAPLHKNGVQIEHQSNASKGSTNKNSSLLKTNKIIAVKNIRLKDLHQNGKNGQFINIHKASSNVAFWPAVCPNCHKILTSRETLASHSKVCRQLYVYACEKCPFVTRNKSDLISHHAVHALIKCPKCSLSFEDKKCFYVHYRKGCKESGHKNIYNCKLCAFSSNQLFLLKTHMKEHTIDSESVELGRNTCPPKESNNKFGQGVVVVTAKSLYAKEYDDVADIADAESLPLRAQSDSVEQNRLINSPQDQSIIDTLRFTKRDHAYSKIERIATENSTNLTKHAGVYRNKSNTCEIVSTDEGLDLGTDKSIASVNSKNLNEHADMYRNEPSTSEIVCMDEDLNIGIDKNVASENSKYLNERADMYRKESSDSEIVCIDEDFNIDIDKNVASENSANLNKQVDMYRQEPSTFEIVCVGEDLNLGTDERVASENSTNSTKQVDAHRKNSSTSKRVCRNGSLNHGTGYHRPYKKKRGNKMIVRYCEKCKRTFEFESYYESRPLCTFCDSKLHLQCTQCDKVMKEYFEAIEHSESDCDKQETLHTQRQVGLPSERNSLSQTDSSPNLYVNNLPSLNNNNHRKKIIRYCQKCKKNSDLVCYYDERPRCVKCQTKLQLKCTLCLKLMTEYFVAVEHAELQCNPKKQVRRKDTQQYTANSSFSKDYDDNNHGTEKVIIFETAMKRGSRVVNSSFSKDRVRDDNETEQEIIFESAKKRGSHITNSSFFKDRDPGDNETEKQITFKITNKRVGRITYDIKSAKVTKICPKCNITAEFDVTSRCKTCYRNSIFQCNRCKINFENYQKVSKHLWTQCFEEGFYHCLKCTFKSTTKLTVQRHCEEYHPEFSDPLGTAKEGDFIEYRATQSNENSSWLPQNISYQPDIPKSTKRVENNINVPARYSRTCHHCKTTFSSRHHFIKHLVDCTRPRVLACEYCPFTTNTQLDLRYHVLSCHSNLPSNNADSLVNSSLDQSKDSPPYKCGLCSHVAQRRTALKFHEARVHSDAWQELLVSEEGNRRKCKIYYCNVCPFKILDRLGELRQHILKVHMKGQDASTLLPCARCGWDFQGCWGLKEHLAYCGKKLSMHCRVNLVRLKIEAPTVLTDNLGEVNDNLIEEDLAETIKEDLTETIKEEAVDLGEFQMEVEP